MGYFRESKLTLYVDRKITNFNFDLTKKIPVEKIKVGEFEIYDYTKKRS